MKNGLHTDEDGSKRWYLNDKLHRVDGPAKEWANGDKCWYLNNKLHRKDGPAVEFANSKHWYLNGLLHREDGPAREWANGSKSWYLNDYCLGEDAEGFWAYWNLLTHAQRCNLNLHFWLVKYFT